MPRGVLQNRAPQERLADQAAKGGDAIGVEDPVEERQPAVLVLEDLRIEQQPDAHERVEDSREDGQPAVGQPPEQPAQRHRLQRPAEGHPLLVELKGNGDRYEP